MVKKAQNAPDWARLGQVLKTWRETHRITQEEVARNGGPSVATLRKLENYGDRLRPETMRDLERALGWPQGYCDQILSGGPEDAPPPPEPVDPADDPNVVMLVFGPGVLDSRSPVERELAVTAARTAVLTELRRLDQEAAARPARQTRRTATR